MHTLKIELGISSEMAVHDQSFKVNESQTRSELKLDENSYNRSGVLLLRKPHQASETYHDARSWGREIGIICGEMRLSVAKRPEQDTHSKLY